MIDKNDIPIDDSIESIKTRKKVIYDFYQEWKYVNPLMRRYNLSLKDYINIRHVSIDETSAHASKKYLSTLAVLQLDAILTYAKRKKITISKAGIKNQKMFEKMIVMEYDCPGIGMVKLTVGVRKTTHEKIQYCITALEI
ncbi:MAG: hypothetical protein IJN30_04380 [Bacteroidales bacterium]|nr:hypothetical protein [Bacteroidales bacterium]